MGFYPRLLFEYNPIVSKKEKASTGGFTIVLITSHGFTIYRFSQNLYTPINLCIENSKIYT
ncbi:hypothetical protein GCM10023331_39360 [Algivirga pacifica]|uniref:Uncharacterized protein n=1 Tax=Algivirga pacifica TaxID=1162670 RepID=A0ABP9DRN2_9BACT